MRGLGGLPWERAAEAVGEQSLKGEGEWCGEGFCWQLEGQQRGWWDHLSCPAAGSDAQGTATRLAEGWGVPARPPYAGAGCRAHRHVLPHFPDSSGTCSAKCRCDQPLPQHSRPGFCPVAVPSPLRCRPRQKKPKHGLAAQADPAAAKWGSRPRFPGKPLSLWRGRALRGQVPWGGGWPGTWLPRSWQRWL